MNDNIVSREKYWEELTYTEKTEKLASQVEFLKDLVNLQGEIIEKLQSHVHVEGQLAFILNVGATPSRWPNPNILNRSPETRKYYHPY